MSRFSDETLMAFADGTLDEPQFSAVATAIEIDPVLAERLHAIVEGGDLARHGFAELLQPVPRQLEASVRASIARHRRSPWWRQLWNGLDLTPTGLVAGALGMAVLAVPVLGLLGSFSQPDPSIGLSGPHLAAALDTTLAGASTELGNGVAMVPILTFTNGDGQLCREFETTGAAAYVAIACRLDGAWRTRFAIATDSEAAYRPAAGLAALDTYLEAIGAGPALLDQAEVDALAR